MKILITGTAGFIGYHLVKKLLSIEGLEIVGLDNINAYYDPSLKLGRLSDCGIEISQIEYSKQITSSLHYNYSFIKGDLTDKDLIEQVFKRQNFDVVVSLAAQAGVRYSLEAPHEFINSNVNGFINILECCRNYPVKHLLFASTSSVYGLNRNMPFSTNQSANHPISLYSATKKANEMMAHSYSHLYSIPSTGLRFFTVYGPWGRPDMALFKFANLILNNKPIDVYNNGLMLRDYTYVGDIVEIISRLLEKPPIPNPDWNAIDPDPSSSSAPYKIFNIGNSKPLQLLKYIEALEDALGVKAIKNMLPIQPGDVLDTFADVTDLEYYTQFKPDTSVETGIKEFVKWYREYYGYRN